MSQGAWPTTAAAAIALQRTLAGQVERQDRLGPVSRIAGVDVGFEDAGRSTRAAVVVFAWPGLARITAAVARVPTGFPYIPGLLSFRELPAVLAALDQLAALPDLLLVDGQGIAHPRRFGIACHLGVLIDRPTIGVGKSRLVGTHAEPGQVRGVRRLLRDGTEVIGTVLRTRAGVRPLYVSIGHRIGLATAVRWVLRTGRRLRLPEPVRAADALASDRGRSTRRSPAL
ncbi:MAG: deoxyribonuclease V [Alphaproteobacteria bacterium]|nr:deoxyribonuclease V [Alphaproteobacteria bacterium]